jgi:hypothetical protein
MTIRGDDRRVGVLEVAPRQVGNRVPVWVKSEGTIGERREIAMLGVIGHVSLVEDYLVPQPRQSADEPSPERCVPIPPGRTDGQTKDD